jgi:hypothetical protein
LNYFKAHNRRNNEKRGDGHLRTEARTCVSARAGRLHTSGLVRAGCAPHVRTCLHGHVGVQEMCMCAMSACERVGCTRRRRRVRHLRAHALVDACAQDAHLDVITCALGSHAESDTGKLSHMPCQAFLLLVRFLYYLV